MREPQLGAMHAIASHFTRYDEPAIVTMPTGSGKTAVISAVPFLLRAERVLVLTPSRMVREQIAEEFRGLLDLRRLGVLDTNVPSPTVHIVEGRINSFQDWLNLRPYDVVIGIPNSISLEIQGISPPPLNFFDVVLVDEAHHAAARSWRRLLEELSPAKQVMFTATPFRRDRRELVGRIAYVYELRDAYRDGVFGQLEYQPVVAQDSDTDLAIAMAATARLRNDQAAGLAHLMMVRTGTKARAKFLADLYSKHTDLKLQVVTGDHSLNRLRKIVELLRKRELDGIVCVDMLGEGFNLPNLKVAALHTPHKSLAVTLQFIGRFARTNAADLGTAVFFALESEMEVEKQRLYDQGAAWEEIIPNLSSARVQEEEHTREILHTFQSQEEGPEGTLDLSLYSLRPYHHVKILRAPATLNVCSEIQPPPGFTIVHRHVSAEQATAVYVLKCRARPLWTSVDHLDAVSHELLILYLHEASGLLFVCSSLRTDGLYDHIAEQFGGSVPLRGLSFKKINRVLLDLSETRFFNIGMRNIAAARPSESYRTLAGPNVDEAIELSDRRQFRRGHWFGSATDNGQSVTIGLSVASKVWSNSSSQIPKLLAWCNRLAGKISTERIPQTNSGLDHLAMGEELTQVPENVVYVDWNESTYLDPIRLTYKTVDGNEVECQLLDLDLQVDAERTSRESVGIRIVTEGFVHNLTFHLEGNPIFFEDDQPASTIFEGSQDHGGFATYLNHNLPTFFTADCGSFEGCNYFEPPNPNAPPFDPGRVEVIEPADNVDIEAEFGTATEGKRTIHAYVQERLLGSAAEIVLYDHGTGELADFVAMETYNEDIQVSLFHCKGSSQVTPGERVGDLYEVCGQAIKSARWVDRKALTEALNRRAARGSVFLRGTLGDCARLLDGRLRPSLQIVLVQPGLRKASITVRTSSLLGAVDDFVSGGRCNRIKVIAS